ncbi:carotenoid oxygenase family protein [Mycolicibacterium austroafricanum]|jgi:all-trans-8'-apo-beta-carotenal 15,15'-oxygenase|uniref:Dioxygenase n=1 Tax=Mycolicibacterium austroafricanum TaxID=39687 RepID=A0ABT8HDX2_MYCAO|nr:carotenoid oxygenase family protein [Mycolicibacterium austroafricanum]MDN4518970.1 carotenoid oxygenase family protein [Mycolicibacterium austroafricanum]PQP44554.1 carotenoid oxygenase [Mycolicibacterium austroafricanum]QRZ04531.1 carotenoid oxygenase family protein [Mycolicibacterium austroafricanum]QZT54697.1 carotenoid oxygenase family protein [Mycolicibacterium austroafricanum]QZT66265.1 carotenoid oxygenase family protein [Mycolicibacterium austroafricanum]
MVAGTRYWDDIDGEFDIPVEEITGTLPEGLTGTLYRNGSGRWNIGSSPVESIYDADGMVSAFVLNGAGVRFRNRFVRTRHFVQSTRAGRPIGRGFSAQRPGGIRANALRLPVNTANTSVMMNNDRLLALWEGGRPHELDPDSLDTYGMSDLGGALRGPVGAYSAHYTLDPETGAKVNFGFDPYFPRIDLRWALRGVSGAERRRRLRDLVGEAVPRVRLRLYETDTDGVTRYLRAVPLPGMGIVHDMALTRRYAIFVVSPMRINPWALTGHASFWDSMRFLTDTPTYFLLAPRSGGPVRTVETDAFYHWHFTNAYDDGDDVVVELPRFAPHTYEGVKNYTAHVRSGSAQVGGADPSDAVVLTRFRIGSSGRVTREPLADFGCEFPQIDPRRSTRRHDYSYVAVQDPVRFQGQGIARIDHRSGAGQVFCPPGNVLVEPTFVPRPGGDAEDDGWVLTVGYQESHHRSRLMVFDAAGIADGPVAEAWLPFHVPMSYHGTFTSRVAR